MSADYMAVERKIDEIEAEMRRIGMWQEEPLPPEMYNFTRAFGMDTMAGAQWLQFILIPRVRSIIAERGDFPNGSAVAVWASREFDGYPGADDLHTLLSEFDRLFD